MYLLCSHADSLISYRSNGVKFIGMPGTGEFVKKWRPKDGDIVSFKHQGFLL